MTDDAAARPDPAHRPDADDDLLEVRPRLGLDVVLARTPEGAHVESGAGGMELRGGSAYAWLQRLAPHLDGRHTLAELCDGLDEARRAVVVDLVAALLRHGAVRRAPAPVGDADPLDPAVRERFDEQFHWIEHHADDGGGTGVPVTDRVVALRAARVRVAGRGETAVAVGRALLRNGVASLVVEQDVRIALAEEERELRAAGCPPAVTVAGRPPAADDATDPSSAAADVVVALGPPGGVPPVTGGAVTLPVTWSDDSVVIGPSVGADPEHRTSGPCGGCALLRAAGRLDDPGAAALATALLAGDGGGAPRPPTGPAARLAGSLVAFEVFRHLTAAPAPETVGAVLVQDRATLETVREALLPHPHCSRCASTEPAAPEPPPGAVGDAGLLGDHVGVLSAPDDDGLVQTPLRVSTLRLARTGAAGRRRVLGFDLDTVQAARADALREAAGEWSSLVAAPCRAAPTPGPPPPAPCRWRTWVSGDTDPHDVLPGRHLATGEPVTVPRALVFPLAGGVASGPGEPGGAGVGAARVPEQARLLGLCSALGHRGLAMAMDGTSPAVTWTPVGSDEWDALLRAAQARGRSVRLAVLPGAAPAAAVAATATGPTGAAGTTVAAATDLTTAAVRALGELLARDQVGDATTGSPWVAGPIVDPLVLEAGTDGGAREPGDARRLAAGDAGGDGAVVVDTTPVDLAAAGWHTVRVLLLREAG